MSSWVADAVGAALGLPERRTGLQADGSWLVRTESGTLRVSVMGVDLADLAGPPGPSRPQPLSVPPEGEDTGVPPDGAEIGPEGAGTGPEAPCGEPGVADTGAPALAAGQPSEAPVAGGARRVLTSEPPGMWVPWRPW